MTKEEACMTFKEFHDQKVGDAFHTANAVYLVVGKDFPDLVCLSCYYSTDVPTSKRDYCEAHIDKIFYDRDKDRDAYRAGFGPENLPRELKDMIKKGFEARVKAWTRDTKSYIIVANGRGHSG